jgi:uncharacterized protein (DUF1800 family)
VNTVRSLTDPDPTVARLASLAYWWTGLMVGQDRTLREKLTLFWSNHFSVQHPAVFNPRFSWQYIQLMRTHSKGNFRQMTYDVTVSGAMLIYLNGYLNNVFAPDENYARELMELFTLGEGSGYTEGDVQAAARVLTGWTVREQVNGVTILPEVIYVPFLHSIATKQFSSFFNNTVIVGQSGASGGPNELNALLDMIHAKDEVSLFICREIYRFFVKGTIAPEVEEDVIQPLAQVFRDHATAPDQMRHVFRALFTSAHFFSPEVRACMIMSPADWVLGGARKLQLPMPAPALQEARYNVWRELYFLMSYCGQRLGDPPDVAGWPAYYQFPQYDNSWMDSTTYPARRDSLLHLLYNGLSTDGTTFDPASANLNFKPDLVQLVGQFSDPMDPNALVADAVDLLFALPVSAAVQQQLKVNYLLLGQQFDHYWSDAYELYTTNPGTTDPVAMLVPQILLLLFIDMAGAAEAQLH